MHKIVLSISDDDIQFVKDIPALKRADEESGTSEWHAKRVSTINRG